jgi:predicted metal-dependent hydrolase
VLPGFGNITTITFYFINFSKKARHETGFFVLANASVQNVLNYSTYTLYVRGDQLYPHAYIQYLVHFHGNRDYFECHEILEDYWKRNDPGNKQSVWVGLIQLAVSCYHHRRNNFTGAKKTLEKAINIFMKEKKCLLALGLNYFELLSLVRERHILIEKNQPYKSFRLPITDPDLLHECEALCSKLGFIWYSDSNINNSSLVHRHKLRDRSTVIEARLNAIKNKKGSDYI